MFNWVCPRCGHDVPPSKTECPFCAPPAPEPVTAQQPMVPQYQPTPPYQAPPPPQQFAPPPQAPQQYWQQPPQNPQAQPYPPQQYPPPPPTYAQQTPQQYWQPPPQNPQGQPYPPQQYPPQQYQAPPQQAAPPPPPPQPEPTPPPPQYPPQLYQPAHQYQAEEARPQQPVTPAPQQYSQASPPQIQQPQYTPPPPPPVPEYRQPERATTPWPPPEERAGRPAWQLGLLAFVGVLAVFGIAYYLMGSHASSAAKDTAAKQQTTNPMQKYIEVVGIRLVTDKSGGQAVKFLVVNHSGNELSDLSANVTLWASTQRSEEDSVGTFTFQTDSIGPEESKELTATLKTDKPPYDQPEDWRNITADVQLTSQ